MEKWIESEGPQGLVRDEVYLEKMREGPINIYHRPLIVQKRRGKR